MSTGEMVQVSKAVLDRLLEKERKSLLNARKAAIKIAILADKAKKQGITVSKEEIDAKLAEQDAKKVSETTPAA